ncbi:MAG: ComF family protein [Treponema sp.]|nr:ComF family protein [Treponema sp.]
MKYFFFAVKQHAAHAVRSLLSLMMGGTECVVCGAQSCSFSVCSSCRKKYFTFSLCVGEERCAVCGRVLVSEHGVCMQCRREKVLEHTDTVLPLFSYRLWNSMLLFRWKINGERALSSFFAEQIALALKALPAFDAVVPVPPRPGKIRKKGWDQIEDICSFLESHYRIAVCRMLARNSKDEQKTLDKNRRLATAKRSYSVKTGSCLKKALYATNGIMPRAVCLIDDVLTTGATIESCASALTLAGVEHIHAVTLFIVD